MRARRAAALALVLGLLSADARPLRAAESQIDDRPPPRELEELGEPLRDAFRRAVRGEPLFPRVRQQLSGMAPFFRDSHLDLHLRSFYFHRRNLDATRSEAATVGGWLGFHSGWWRDTLAVEWKLMTSQSLHAPDSRPGTLLLRPRQRSYTAGAAVANLKLRRGDQELILYRQELDLPYVNKRDNRMTPITFEGVVAKGRVGDFKLLAAHLTKIKLRNRDEFVSMSKAAGVPGTSSKGMSLAGLRWQPGERFSLGVMDYWVKDTLNTAYAEASYRFPIRGELSAKLEAQFTDQRSVGRDLLLGESFDTQRVGVRGSLGYRNGILSVAFSSVASGNRIRSPYGSDAGYLSLMQRDFKRAGEDAWLVGLSYHFDRFDLPGLSAALNLARGTGARDETGSLPDRKEADLTLDYRIREGRLRGFWLRLRASVLDEEAGRTRNDFRAILNYEIPLF